MENGYDYKDEIISSRKGFLGASDALLIMKVDNLGYVPSSCNQRLAILKGLYEKTDDFKTEAMGIGDDVENQIFEILYSQDKRWESNPRYESICFKRKNLNLLAHIDFQLVDEEKKVVTWVECKATNKDIEIAKSTYKGQLFIEYILGREFTSLKGKDWKFNLKLCHYNTTEYNGELDAEKIDMQLMRFGRPPLNIANAMDIIDEYLETFNEYTEDGVVLMKMTDLPQTIQEKISLCLEYWQNENSEEYRHYEEMKEAVKSFKEYMYGAMVNGNITERINFVDLGKSMKLKLPYDKVSFDAKKFKDEHKYLYKKYSYISQVKGSVLINNIKENGK